MPTQVPQATFDAIAKDMLASAGDSLIAQHKSFATVEAAYEGTGSDAYANYNGVVNSLQALVDDLRS